MSPMPSSQILATVSIEAGVEARKISTASTAQPPKCEKQLFKRLFGKFEPRSLSGGCGR